MEGRGLGGALSAGSRPAPPSELDGGTGILGGTFDPVHYGHLAVAEDVRETLGLERVLFVPAGIPPHKPDRLITPPAHRVAMVELAIAGNPAFALSRVEVDRTGPSYAADTVELLIAEAAADGRSSAFVFIMSADAFALLHTWHEPERLLRACRLAVVPRPGHRTPGRPWVAEHFPGLEDRVLFPAGPDLGHSASAIRARVAAGRSIRYLVPPAVAAYIAEHDLYPPELWRKN